MTKYESKLRIKAFGKKHIRDRSTTSWLKYTKQRMQLLNNIKQTLRSFGNMLTLELNILKR